MEPGDLRINSRLREESGVPKSSPNTTYAHAAAAAAAEGNSVLHFRNHNVRQGAVITDSRLHHVPSSIPGNPLILDRYDARNEPVKVWRDPNLMNSGEIRHVVSMQHSGVVHLSPHAMLAAAHGNVNPGASVYHAHPHDNKPLDATSRGPSMNTTDVLRGRGPIMYAPQTHPQTNPKTPLDAWRPGLVQNPKDVRVSLTGKSTVEQAVQDHFVESLRLAHLKGSTTQPLMKDERPNPHMAVQMQRFYPPPQDKRHHPPDLQSQQQLMYQLHQQHQQALQAKAQELPQPPPLKSEQHQQHQYRTPPQHQQQQQQQQQPEPPGRKHPIYGNPELMVRAHENSQQSIRYESEQLSRHDVLPSDNCVRFQKLNNLPAPSPRRATPQQQQQQQQNELERNQSPFGKHVTPSASPNSYHMYPQAHLIASKHKVTGPTPSHMYGKPPGRQYEMMGDPAAPIPLTSKGGLTRPSQSSPTQYTHSSPTLPQHDVRKSDVAYYMYNNGPPGFHQPPSMPPQQAHMHAIQTQPLDLGGKRKQEEDMYKGPIPDYPEQKSIYGSRNKPTLPIEEARQKMSLNHHSPLSLTVTEATVKRKMEDSGMPLHMDPKKVRSDNIITTTVISSSPSSTLSISNHHLPPQNYHQNMVARTMSESLNKVNRPPPAHASSSPSPSSSEGVAPISLIASGSGDPSAAAARLKPNPTQANPIIQSTIPLDIHKSIPSTTIKSIGAESDTHSISFVNSTSMSSAASVSSVSSSSNDVVCNGGRQSVPLISTSVVTETKIKSEQTSEPQTSLEPYTNNSTSTSSFSAPPTPSQSGSSTTTTAAASPVTTPAKFTKVLKKAWLKQWHEGDGNDKTADNQSPRNGDEAVAAVAVNNNNTTKSEDCKDKVLNGNGVSTSSSNGTAPATGADSDGKSQSTSSSSSVNGFGKEKQHESDLGSENESDNNGKEKALTDNGILSSASSSPTKKNGRKGKDSNGNRQSSPKPDLRKDGLCKRPPVTQLKKTGESFIQAETCNRVQPKIGKCRECRWHPSARGSKKQSGAYCRFYGFRKLRYTKGGSLTVAGFSDPFTDPPKITEHDQFRLWLPSANSPGGLDVHISKFLITQLCQPFCDLVQQEEEARSQASTQESSVIAWKPLLKGVREMCDVCDTTLFNFHWACAKCGFVVCLSCFKLRKNEIVDDKVAETTGKDRDEFHWLLCSNRTAHELDKLMLVQTIAGDALTDLNDRLHRVCNNWDITLDCVCNDDNKVKAVNDTTGQDSKKEESEVVNDKNDNNLDSSQPQLKNESNEKDLAEKGSEDKKENESEEVSTDKEKNELSEAVIMNHNSKISAYEKIRKRALTLNSDSFNGSESSVKFPSVKHSWLCNGKLLRLLEPENPENFDFFHEVWKRGQPVLVSNVADKLDKSLWTPESFSKDFGDYKNDLVNWPTGTVITNQQMKKFWDGFSSLSKRLQDDDGKPMLLKLKDWPPTDDFSQTLPTRFQDLMKALPLPEYTLKDGKRNLASRLPTEFMKPDLGPKMYIAYGSSSPSDKGTTNLHSVVSDSVNILVYCEAPQDTDQEEHKKAILEAIEHCDCDSASIERILEKKEVPGAVWHLYEAKDAETIKTFLNKVATEEQKEKKDSVFDYSWYLDKTLRKRLLTEHNVSGYAILQCAGDAIFIPAGAPHQVHNLQSCITVEEDFVSPENISHSFYLSEEEFLDMSENHSSVSASSSSSNREDKLQIKNIVYHSVKDAITVLLLHNSEKSENSSKQTIDTSTALSKDCQRSTPSS